MKLEPEEIQALADAVAERLAKKLAESPGERAPLMTISQVAELLNYSTDTVRRLADAGEIPCVRFSATSDRRFPREELMKAIEQQARRAS